MRRLIYCGLALFALCAVSAADAATLLGSATVSWNASNSNDSYLNVTTMANELGSTSTPEAPDCSMPMVGCEGIPVASLVPGAVFTFDATHGSNFAQVATMLTNGVVDQLWFVTQARDASGNLVGGANWQFRLESQQFHVPTDFVGNTVTSITFTVNAFGLGGSGGTGAPGISWGLSGVWKIFGTPASVPAQARSWGSLKSLYR